MPPTSKSVKSFADVHQAFEQAARLGSVTLSFLTPQKATTFTSRANAYRVLLRQQNQEAGREFASEFDHLKVCRSPGDTIVQIMPRGFDFKMLGPDGAEIKLDPVTATEPVPTPFEVTAAEKEAADFLAEYEKDLKP